MTGSPGALSARWASNRSWAAITLGLALGPAVALGLGRFAYGLLLPTMRSDLSWSFAQAGTMNSANAGGYLLGAFLAAPIAARSGARRAFIGSMLVTALALVGCAASGSFAILFVLRLVAGITGAVTFIVGATLAAHVARGSEARTALVLGLYFAGAGFGIAVTGLLIPQLVANTAAGNWRWAWLVLGALAFAGSAAALPAVRRAPEPTRASTDGTRGWRPGPTAVTMVAYALFGAGYIAYVTFIVAFLKAEGSGTGRISAFWVLFGLAAIAWSFVWSPVLGRLRSGSGIGLVIGVVTLGALLPLIWNSSGGAFVSALLFGTFLTVPAAVTAFARRVYEPQLWTKAIAALTVAFALGQCLGPVLAGVISDGPSGVRAGLTLSVAILAAAALLAVAQPQRET
jgi:predicted MFS family arabinose efflux permease